MPVPNKRDTLGLFQFPWGDTSDSAAYQPVFNPALMSGPVFNVAAVNASLDGRSRQLEAKETEDDYSKSFFEEYEDEDMDLDEMDPESDDDFDESTLWEIANLLKTNEVPSKHSLLPAERPKHEADIEEPDSEYEEEATSTVQHPEVKFPIMPLTKIAPKMELLWTCTVPTKPFAQSVGLTEPDSRVWRAYLERCDSTTRPRPKIAAVAQLNPPTTSRLWTSLAKGQPQHHWITESSVRPSSPSVNSVDSSTKSSPISETSDASSIASADTKASSILSSGITVPAWWDRHGSKKTLTSPSSTESAKLNSKIPVRHQPVKPLPSVRESRVLVSRDLWEKRASMTEDSPPKKLQRLSSNSGLKLDDSAKKVVAVANVKPEVEKTNNTGSMKASKADWDKALAKAVAASRLRIARVRATSHDWDCALEEAVSASKTTKPSLELNPAVLHPVFFMNKLISGNADVHPAAIGHVIEHQTLMQTPQFDAATRHPVFFGKIMGATTSECHPAAVGYIEEPEARNAEMYDAAIRHPVFFTESFAATSSIITQQRQDMFQPTQRTPAHL